MRSWSLHGVDHRWVMWSPVCVDVYLDDILIYLYNIAEHHTHVREVLRRLRDNNLYAKIEKCKFDVQTTNFLGFVISSDGP